MLRNRHFVLLWLAQAISQTAQNAIWFGLLIVVEERTHSTTQMGFAVLTTILPSIVLGMVAGVFVDRLTKNRVLVATNFLRAVVVLGYLLYDRALVLVFLVNLVSSTITQFFGPAEAAKIPQLVGRRQLITANSLFNLTFNGAQLVGMVLLAPPLVKIFGPAAVFTVSAVAFAVAGVLVTQLPPEPPPTQTLQGLDKSALARHVWHDVKEGWQFITSDRRTSLAMLHLTMASALMLIVAMLAPRYVVAALGIRADDAVYVLAPAGLGVLVGTTTMSRLAGRFAKEKMVAAGLLAMGVFILLLSVVRGVADLVLAPALGLLGMHTAVAVVPVVMVFAAVLGLALSLVIIPSQTILMERAPLASRGRIFSVQMVLGNVASVAPLLFIGTMADLFGVNVVIALLAVGIFGIWGVSTEWFALRIPRRSHSIGDK
ncbi:MAG: MFS transporter [Chloroflexota bacterium]